MSKSNKAMFHVGHITPAGQCEATAIPLVATPEYAAAVGHALVFSASTRNILEVVRLAMSALPVSSN